MKLLLYCTKAKPYLEKDYGLDEISYRWKTSDDRTSPYTLCGLTKKYNGKIVAECDFEVEEHKETTNDWLCMSLREKIVFGNLCEKASIDELKCYEYANGKPLYAIHIKNLKIFDKPKELRFYYYKYYNTYSVLKAPQNMMYVYDDKVLKVLISIKPEWLCKILNGEKTVEIRKKILKEMLCNEQEKGVK